MTRHRGWVASGVLLLAVSSGCKKIQEKLAAKADESAVEAATSGTVDPESGNGTVTLTGESGAMVAMGGDNAKVPDSWPASVPVYPSGTLKGSMSASASAAAGKFHHTLTYETADDAAKVVQFYADNLKGFTKSSELNLGGNVIASFEGEGKVVALTVSKMPGASLSMLNLMVTNKNEPSAP